MFDPHAPGQNGVTRAIVDKAMMESLGDYLAQINGLYETDGPPPKEMFLSIMYSVFGLGFSAGFKESRIQAEVDRIIQEEDMTDE